MNDYYRRKAERSAERINVFIHFTLSLCLAAVLYRLVTP